MAKKKATTRRTRTSKVSKGGSEIIRHKAPKAESGPIPKQLSEREMLAVEAFYSTTIGKHDTVFHEILSPDVHIDIIPIPSSKKSKWTTVATMGMSAVAMNSPRGCPKHAELAMQLPSDWPLDEKSLGAKDGKHYWPIEWIKCLARFPMMFDTFFDFGHTVPMEGISSSRACPFACAMMLPLMGVENEKQAQFIAGRKTVHVFSVIPLFEEEMELKLELGVEALADAMDSAKLQPWETASPKRVNVGKVQKRIR
jgi:hypothetical protein